MFEAGRRWEAVIEAEAFDGRLEAFLASFRVASGGVVIYFEWASRWCDRDQSPVAGGEQLTREDKARVPHA